MAKKSKNPSSNQRNRNLSLSFKWLELKIFPPLAALIFLLFAYLFSWLFPNKEDIFNFTIFSFHVKNWLAIITFLSGLVFLISANFNFRRKGTTLNPKKPKEASKLVTDGIFSYSRNPMYLGLTFILLGFGFLFESWIALLLPILFILYITEFQIKPEERILIKKFGKSYENYIRKVRRWL